MSTNIAVAAARAANISTADSGARTSFGLVTVPADEVLAQAQFPSPAIDPEHLATITTAMDHLVDKIFTLSTSDPAFDTTVEQNIHVFGSELLSKIANESIQNLDTTDSIFAAFASDKAPMPKTVAQFNTNLKEITGEKSGIRGWFFRHLPLSKRLDTILNSAKTHTATLEQAKKLVDDAIAEVQTDIHTVRMSVGVNNWVHLGDLKRNIMALDYLSAAVSARLDEMSLDEAQRATYSYRLLEPIEKIANAHVATAAALIQSMVSRNKVMDMAAESALDAKRNSELSFTMIAQQIETAKALQMGMKMQKLTAQTAAMANNLLSVNTSNAKALQSQIDSMRASGGVAINVKALMDSTEAWAKAVIETEAKSAQYVAASQSLRHETLTRLNQISTMIEKDSSIV